MARNKVRDGGGLGGQLCRVPRVLLRSSEETPKVLNRARTSSQSDDPRTFLTDQYLATACHPLLVSFEHWNLNTASLFLNLGSVT